MQVDVSARGAGSLRALGGPDLLGTAAVHSPRSTTGDASDLLDLKVDHVARVAGHHPFRRVRVGGSVRIEKPTAVEAQTITLRWHVRRPPRPVFFGKCGSSRAHSRSDRSPRTALAATAPALLSRGFRRTRAQCEPVALRSSRSEKKRSTISLSARPSRRSPTTRLASSVASDTMSPRSSVSAMTRSAARRA